MTGSLARAGRVETPHGGILTPAFVPVATRAALRGVTVEMARELGAEILMANTYHLHFTPGEEVVREGGGVSKFMNWNGPTMTDSGGFQVFSLGAGFGRGVGKLGGLASKTHLEARPPSGWNGQVGVGTNVKIDDDGVDFRSPIDGRKERFTPERSIDIQHALGADIIFAFDECTSPEVSYAYQKLAMTRTHAWAKRSLEKHQELLTSRSDLDGDQGPSLFGIVQGGRHEDLRRESAEYLAALPFDGFGIGGSFDKEDVRAVVALVNEILPEGKPRHLLGIGGVDDLFDGVESGVDTFDCVSPTRLARHGALETGKGRVNILNSSFRSDQSPIEDTCECYTCRYYSRNYIAHLFRAKELLGVSLASIHNLYFFVNLVKRMRQAILNDKLPELRQEFLVNYQR